MLFFLADNLWINYLFPSRFLKDLRSFIHEQSSLKSCQIIFSTFNSNDMSCHLCLLTSFTRQTLPLPIWASRRALSEVVSGAVSGLKLKFWSVFARTNFWTVQAKLWWVYLLLNLAQFGIYWNLSRCIPELLHKWCIFQVMAVTDWRWSRVVNCRMGCEGRQMRI